MAEGIAQGLPAEWPTGTGAMTGSVGITRRQSDAPDAGLDLLVALIHRHA